MGGGVACGTGTPRGEGEVEGYVRCCFLFYIPYSPLLRRRSRKHPTPLGGRPLTLRCPCPAATGIDT